MMKRRMMKRRMNESAESPEAVLSGLFAKLSDKEIDGCDGPVRVYPDDHGTDSRKYGVRWDIGEDGAHGEIFFIEDVPGNLKYEVVHTNGAVIAEDEGYEVDDDKHIDIVFSALKGEIEDYIEEMSKIDPDEMDIEELISQWNNYCDQNRYDESIHPMDEFDEMFGGDSPSDIAQMVLDSGNVLMNDHYFMVGSDGSLVTFTRKREILDNIDVSDLAKWLNNNR